MSVELSGSAELGLSTRVELFTFLLSLGVRERLGVSEQTGKVRAVGQSVVDPTGVLAGSLGFEDEAECLRTSQPL